MTTPQNELHRLANRIERLTDMFEAESENGETIFDAIMAIRQEVSDLMYSQQRLENQMNLIIKLLGHLDPRPIIEQDYIK